WGQVLTKPHSRPECWYEPEIFVIRESIQTREIEICVAGCRNTLLSRLDPWAAPGHRDLVIQCRNGSCIRTPAKSIPSCRSSDRTTLQRAARAASTMAASQ